MQRFSAPLLTIFGLVIVLVLAQIKYIDSYLQTVLMFIGVNIILSTSLNIINGYMGEFACGHAGFMAVGAYVSSILNVMLFTNDKNFGLELLPPEMAAFFFPLTLIIGGIIAAITGLLVAIPSFKTRDDYLAIITIAANYIIISTLINMESIGGPRGFMGMKKIVFAMQDTFDIPWMLLWVGVFCTLNVMAIRRLMSSTYGKAIIAIKQDEIAAEIMSVDTDRIKLVAFMFSSGLAGIAGGLFAHILGYINPNSFGILKSTECLVMVYLGGMGSLSGSVLSAIIFTLLLEALRFVIPAIDMVLHTVHLLPDSYELSQVWKWVIIPLLLILIMQFRPEGIMGDRELSDIFPRLKRYFSFS
jgi:branched-chain amino acid transport system permease protein